MQAHLLGENGALYDRLVPLLREEGLGIARGKSREPRVLVIVGPEHLRPLAVAQRVRKRTPGVHVLIVVDDDRFATVREEMMMTPGIGKDLELIPWREAAPERLQAAIRGAVAASRSRAQIEEANTFLGRARQLI